MARLEKSDTVPGFFTVHVDAHELQCDVRALPYPTCVGVIDVRRLGGKIDVWTPAASVPRGYHKAAKALLESKVDEVFAMFSEMWNRPAPRAAMAHEGEWTLESGRTLCLAGKPIFTLDRYREAGAKPFGYAESVQPTGYHTDPHQADMLAKEIARKLNGQD